MMMKQIRFVKKPAHKLWEVGETVQVERHDESFTWKIGAMTIEFDIQSLIDSGYAEWVEETADDIPPFKKLGDVPKETIDKLARLSREAKEIREKADDTEEEQNKTVKFIPSFKKHETPLLDYRKMLMDIDSLVNNDWGFEIDCKLAEDVMKGKKHKWTQKEAEEMANVIMKVYKISHGYDGCCAGRYKYEVEETADSIPQDGETRGGYYKCSCGAVLQTQEDIQEHRRLGCWERFYSKAEMREAVEEAYFLGCALGDSKDWEFDLRRLFKKYNCNKDRK